MFPSQPFLSARMLGSAISIFICTASCGSACAADVTTTPRNAAAEASSASAAVDAAGRPIDVAALVARLRAARFILLGEIHDNPDHHRLRADLLRALLSDGVATRVVFEQIDREHTAALAEVPRDAESIATAGQLDRKSWGWPLHRPVVEAALAGGATIIGGNLARAETTQVMRGGVTAAPAELRRWITAPPADALTGDGAWTAPQEAEVIRQVDEGHCHALPATLLAPMALAQRARDASLALAMTEAPAGTRVVLIAGNGHVRSDTGVPHYLRLQLLAKASSSGPASKPAPADAVLSVGFLEAAPGTSAVADAPYDEAWFTPAISRPDPCERLPKATKS
jgi:uncharacterized iron-regulated protein